MVVVEGEEGMKVSSAAANWVKSSKMAVSSMISEWNTNCSSLGQEESTEKEEEEDEEEEEKEEEEDGRSGNKGEDFDEGR